LSHLHNRKESLRSVIISQQLLGTREVAVIHHTDCGMLTFTTQQLQDQLKGQYPAAAKEIESIDFLPFPDLEESVKNDVKYLKDHPLVLNDSTVTGWVYEVETGKVRLEYVSLQLLMLLIRSGKSSERFDGQRSHFIHVFISHQCHGFSDSLDVVLRA
jgi:hypothetical protein